ncbi:metalloreductase STEAP4-like [Osmerus eperlanus]|uniref:metalloreductase STEAP4-like n=1 Tax=Osmerus eperlanus TaxID=29151 RepID=UPI002E115D18
MSRKDKHVHGGEDRVCVPVSVGPLGPPKCELVCIFGTGDLGRSLGQRLLQAGYTVVFGSRRPHTCGRLRSTVCGDSAEAKQGVVELATRLGLSSLDRGCLSSARELEDIPLQLFPQWRLRLAIGLTASFFFYLLTRDVIYTYATQGKDVSFRIIVSLANKVFPIVSLIMLSLCYLPGVLAGILQLYRGTKYRSDTCLILSTDRL